MNLLDKFLQEETEEEQINVHSRFNDAPWMSELKNSGIHIIGLGNIGSWLSLYAARTPVKTISIHDFDKVEIHNLGGQLYSTSDLEEYKVFAIKNLISNLTEYNMNKFLSNTAKISNSSSLTYSQCIFSCVDNMATRSVLFSSFERGYSNIFIDGRSNAEHFQVLVVTKDNKKSIEEYKNNYLFEDKDAPDAPCNFKSTSHCGAQLASIMWSVFLNYLTNKEMKMDVREVPFMIEVNLSNMLYDVKFLK